MTFRFVFLIALLSFKSASANTLAGLEQKIAEEKWSEAVEVSQQILKKDPSNNTAKLKGAYSLFQMGLTNSALVLLKKIPPAAWKQFPQGQDRFVEVVALFQKRVPVHLLPGRLDQLDENSTPASLKNEVQFARGRAAFDAKQDAAAKNYLNTIAKGSRFYNQARYLIASIAARAKDYATAKIEFSKVFEPNLMDQSSEFWGDMKAQSTSHWGANLKVQLDSGGLREGETVGELALLGLARVAYATQDYANAIVFYDRLQASSRFINRAYLEKVWTLMSLNRHTEAEQLASQLSIQESTFQSLEARPLRALVLTDAGRTEEARTELRVFLDTYANNIKTLAAHKANSPRDTLPQFVQADLENDQRLRMLTTHQENVQSEIEQLKNTDKKEFPSAQVFIKELTALIQNSKLMEGKVVTETVQKRKQDLERLRAQAKLIEIETLLQDREILRERYQQAGTATEEKQNEHDELLANLLLDAIKKGEALIKEIPKINPLFVFRQSELMWEYSTALAILDQQKTEQEKKQSKTDEKITQWRKRALALAQQVIALGPSISVHSDALFFSGFANIELGATQNGTKVFRDYIKQYPKHDHVPDAYRLLADMQFDVNRFKEAEEDFKKVLEFEHSPAVGYSLYKIGWCAYNSKNYAKALLAFEKAFQWTASSPTGSLSLRTESRNDLVTVYAEVGDSKKADEYFKRFYKGEEKTEATAWLGELARVLDSMGQFEKSAAIYRRLVTLHGENIEAVTYQASIIMGAFRLHRWDEVLKATEYLADTYGHLLKSVPSDATPDTAPEKSAEKILRQIVLARIAEAKTSDASHELKDTKSLSSIYLETFGNWPSSQEPLYRFAQYLLKIEKLPEAVQAFRRNWVSYKTTMKEPVREEAIRNLIYSLDQSEAKLLGKKEEKKDDKKTEKKAENEPVLLSDATQEIFGLTEEYLKDYPRTKYTRPIAFLRSAILFQQGKTDEATAESRRIFDENPEDDSGKRAFRNLRLALYEKKDWEHLYRWSSEELDKRSPAYQTYTADLKAIREESLFLWAEATGDDKKAAELYLKIADNPEMARLKDKSLYNTFVRLRGAGELYQAAQVANRLEKEAPQFEALDDIAGTRAAILQEAGDYAGAYPLLEDFLKAGQSGKLKEKSPEAMQTARMNLGLIAEALDRPREATHYFKEYIKNLLPGQEPGEAKRALARLEPVADNSIVVAKGKWSVIAAKQSAFEKVPLAKSNDLAAKIKGGAERLEKLALEITNFAGNEKTPISVALEAYCSLPAVYDSYTKAVLRLGGTDAELQGELEKVVAPIEIKTNEIVQECLKKSADASHDGPVFKSVNQRWGWEKDEKLAAVVKEVVADMQRQPEPYFDVLELKNDEEGRIIDLHLKGKWNVDTWYELGLIRKQQGKLLLSRLTFLDALAKKFTTQEGRTLNALNALDQMLVAKNQRSAIPISTLIALYDQAARAGSGAAWANLAVLNLKVSRLNEALVAFKAARDNGFFKRSESVKLLLESNPPEVKNDK